MKKILTNAVMLLMMCAPLCAGNIIKVTLGTGTAEQCLADALEKARKFQGKPVTIQLTPDIYRIPREDAVVREYHVSNTCSEEECADVHKHIALFMRGLKNVTLDGQGSTLMLDGELTSFVIDSCQNIVIKDLKIDNAHPTQVEMTVEENGSDYLKCCVHPTSQYRIKDGKLEWYGNGWAWTYGIAQMFDYQRNITWRSWSPMDALTEAKELSPNHLYLKYSQKPDVPVGTVFQIRDSYRREVCGLLTGSRNIKLEGVNFYYLGNFGVASQITENITFSRCRFAPEEGSGRTNAGFADFLHFSGCKGKIDVVDSYFCGAHDDPINVHGTHLKVAKFIDRKHILLKYMHCQTYGFQQFFRGDSIDIVDPNTLVATAQNVVQSAKMVSPREIEVTLVNPLKADFLSSTSDWVVENTTWTPRVYIANNYFCRIPTRGILVTTRRKVVIENNTFYAMQHSGILVADDGKSWYESGPARDVLIRKNTFLECGDPVINVCPENSDSKLPVHKNISILGNYFKMKSASSVAISAKAVDGLTIENNLIEYPAGEKNENAIVDTNCSRVVNKDNRIE